tara:strand:+ start:20737 stop:21207 length:471 start_codon:yes stop_codon:yes gene_type:complete
MGAGGEAPPVKSEDVLILIGSTILLLIFIMQTWSTSVKIEATEEFDVKYDLSEGDIFSLDLIDGEVRPTVGLPNGEYITDFPVISTEDNWKYTATQTGVHVFNFVGIQDSELDHDVSRGIIYDYGLYPLGFLILGFGLLKKRSAQNLEPVEALLED